MIRKNSKGISTIIFIVCIILAIIISTVISTIIATQFAVGPQGDQGPPGPVPDETEATGEGEILENMHPYMGLKAVIATQGVFPSRNGISSSIVETPFIGQIAWVAFNFEPRGWAECNGQLLSISQHTALFSLLGTTYGGDGRTTFALPDLRGRSPLHIGQGLGLTNRALGDQGGMETVTITTNEMPSHAHDITATP